MARSDYDVSLSSSVYRRSGMKFLVNALVISHDDIYSNYNSTETLNDMYLIMNGDENGYGDVMVSDRYPELKKYMSDEAFEKMKRTDYRNEWQDKFIASWAYSFWARRHNDGVDKAAYKILKAIDRLY